MEVVVSCLDFNALDFLDQLGKKTQKEHYLKEILRLFFEQSEIILIDIQHALAAKDYSQLKALVHKLKGGASSVGAQSLNKHCREYESWLSNIDEKNHNTYFNQMLKIEAEYSKSKQMLQNHLLKSFNSNTFKKPTKSLTLSE